MAAASAVALVAVQAVPVVALRAALVVVVVRAAVTAVDPAPRGQPPADPEAMRHSQSRTFSRACKSNCCRDKPHDFNQTRLQRNQNGRLQLFF